MPMDEQLCLIGFGLSLEEKIVKAIEGFKFYEHNAIELDPAGYYLCDSFGKDSCVILDLAIRSGVRFVAHHNLTTLDPPELVYFGRKHHPETVIHRPEKPMLRYFSEARGQAYTPPTRTFRWCCSIYKEQAVTDGIRVFGVRAAESNRRRANWKVFQRSKAGQWVFNPILYWTDSDVWGYLRNNAIPYCDLYDNGLDRLGCVGCPMSDRQSAFKRWPRYEAAWKRAFERFYNELNNRPRKDGKPRWIAKYGSAEKLWEWWMEEMPKEDAANDCQMGMF